MPTCTPQCIRLRIPMLRNRCRAEGSYLILGSEKVRLSNLIKFHDVEHLEEDGIDVGVPALVEMSVAPMGDGRGLHLGIDVIHDGTLLIQIGDQVGIILYPGTDTCLALHFTKGGGSVCDDRINRILG